MGKEKEPLKQFQNVFVTVGTTRFDNLIKTILSEPTLTVLNEMGCKRLLIQAGASASEDLKTIDHDLMRIEIYRYKDSILKDIEQADLVIGHGGAGTALDVLRGKKPFLMVINDGLMNNHQFELARTLHRHDYALHCQLSDLNNVLPTIGTFSFKEFPPAVPDLFAGFLNEKLFGIAL